VEAGPLYLHLIGLAVCAIGLVLVLMVMIEHRYRLGD
jgi:hypothetical protein